MSRYYHIRGSLLEVDAFSPERQIIRINPTSRT